MRSRKPPSETSLQPMLDAEDDERRLFAQELAGVRPLSGPSRIPLAPPRRTGLTVHRKPNVSASLERMSIEEQGERIRGAVSGVSHETRKALARGDLRFDATCDLHGLSAELARHRLERFIAESTLAGRRVVLLICGRGLHSGPDGPALRKVAVEALCQGPLLEHVLAFTSAPAARGGDGALAVLLRRSARLK